MRVPTHTTAKGEAVPVDPVSQWRNFTEDLIFAAAYYDDPRTGPASWIRALDLRKIRHNPEDENRKCRELSKAINALSPDLPTRMERAHAANDHPTFRLVNSRLLPERP
jgi:hypothetical protein